MKHTNSILYLMIIPFGTKWETFLTGLCKAALKLIAFLWLITGVIPSWVNPPLDLSD
jgi:hypothetical protein